MAQKEELKSHNLKSHTLQHSMLSYFYSTAGKSKSRMKVDEGVILYFVD